MPNNTVYKGKIDTLAFGGQGILRQDGFVIFIPFTVPGDEVTIELTKKKKQFGFGRILSIDKPSALRITPQCPYFGTCGGCQLQHIPYNAQLATKQKWIQEAFQRIGKFQSEVPPVVPSHPWNYRRHVRMNLRPADKGFKAGYIGWDNETFLAVEQCPIFHPPQDPILRHLQIFLESIDNTDIKQASVRIFRDLQDKYLLAFSFSPHLPAKIQELSSRPPSIKGMIFSSFHETVSVGDTSCAFEMFGLQLNFSPFGFVQNNWEQSEHLYKAIAEHTNDKMEKILDLYCGIGITSLLFSKMGKKVIGVESHEETVELARVNAEKNGLTNIAFKSGKAEEIVPEILTQFRPDTVLCNPPRVGIDPTLLQALLNYHPQYIFYISCMPSTLARDLKPLIEGGYAIEVVQGFDMFPQTTHVETLVLLKSAQHPPR